MDRTQQVDVLVAMGWDLRTLGEAQVRSVTALQRCIEEYRKSGDQSALREIRRCLTDLEARSHQAKESYRDLVEVVAALQAVDAQ